MGSAEDLVENLARPGRAIEDWKGRLAALVGDVESWVAGDDWSTRRIEKTLNDAEFGSHLVPALLMQKETTRIILEPVARLAPGAEGVVDLYLLPAYDDVATFYRDPSGWNVQRPGDESGEPEPLTREVLLDVVDQMTRHAA